MSVGEMYLPEVEGPAEEGSSASSMIGVIGGGGESGIGRAARDDVRRGDEATGRLDVLLGRRL